jgi:predicted dehydrogenase
LFSLPPSHPKYWRVDSAQSGGGPLVDVGSHRLDVFLALAGRAARVAGFASHRFIDGDVEDVCSAIIEYRSGVQATLSSLWCVSPSRGDYEVICTQGQIHVADARGGRLVVRTERGEKEILVPPDELHDLPLIDRFVDAAGGKSELELSGEAGLEIQRITDAVYDSASNGTMIELSQDAAS